MDFFSRIKFELKANILTHNWLLGKGAEFWKKMNFDNFVNKRVLEKFSLYA